MMTEQQQTGICLEPDYAENFQCDGQRCGAWCCRHWCVYVDEQTYQRYLGLPAEDRERVLAHVEKNTSEEELARGPLFHAKLNFEPTGICQFLREDKLCGLQRKFGEQYIGDTCALYPRHVVRIGRYLEKALSLSCPLVAELALLREELPRLVERELPFERQAAWVETACGEGEEGMAEAFMLLQLMGWQVLAVPATPLRERLQRLLACMEQADSAVEEGDLEELQRLSERYGQSGEAVPAGKVAVHQGDSAPLLPEAALDSLHEVLAPVEAESKHTANIAIIQTAYSLPAQARLLENYVLAEFYLGLYPCRLDGTLRHNVAVVYALAALAEETISAAHASGDAAKVLAACARLSTLANHDQEWLQALSEWVRENASKYILA